MKDHDHQPHGVITLPFAGNGCDLHRYHWPRVAEVELHHIWPKYMGGPADGALIKACPTGHSNVHIGIRWLTGAKTASTKPRLGEREWFYAEEALRLSGVTPS